MLYKKALLCTLLISSVTASDPTSYGWNIPNTPLNIGGYIDATYESKREDEFMFNDIALLFSAHKNHFDLLGEVEISDLTLDGKSNGSRDIEIILERLQVSYALENEQILTVGRFNSSVGYWNQAPINILQDTTTKPNIVKNIFPKATTGVMYQKGIGDEDSLTLALQYNRDIGSHDESIVVDRHMAIAYYGVSSDELSWRLSAGSYREFRGDNTRYLGVGTQYDSDEFALQGEFFIQKHDHGLSIPYSGYLQSVWHFTDKHDSVLRLERYKDEFLDVSEIIFLLGYVYRPWERFALKGEYIYHSKLPLNRFVYSFSVMF
ncbi:MAG TPA: hypothetical protein EYG67_00835 [Campylobacterales bacterium]|nr:hypothetical protein [Campylobacterales bacterium]